MAQLIPEAERMAALQAAGVSDPILRLARGEANTVHDAFVFWCETPWYGYFADRQGRVPQNIPWGGEPGDTLIPLWGWGDMMTLCHKNAGGETYFVQLSIEDATHELWPVAETEQGLLADLMIDVIESLDWSSSETWDGDARQTSEDAAQAVGFRFLPETFAFLDTFSASNYVDDKRAFTRSL